MLDQELNRLPRKYRVPLILCYLKGRTHDQAAEELGCPVGTVRSRLARGRDLLRRRLTSRGHAPTAAILGKEAALPARLFTEAVPPSLVSATVKAALGIGASKTMQAGAVGASALALTQGVLTTMKLAQLKLIGMAILATSLSAGGVVAVSYAAGQSPKAALDAGGCCRESRRSAGTSRFAGSRRRESSSSPSVEERLKALEKKLDELLSRSTPQLRSRSANTASNSSRPASAQPWLNQQDDDARRIVDPQHRSIQELEAELKLALSTKHERSSFQSKARFRNLANGTKPGSSFDHQSHAGRALMMSYPTRSIVSSWRSTRNERSEKKPTLRPKWPRASSPETAVERREDRDGLGGGRGQGGVGNEGRLSSGCHRGGRDRGGRAASATTGTATSRGSSEIIKSAERVKATLPQRPVPLKRSPVNDIRRSHQLIPICL